MAYISKLVRGTASIDLCSGRYSADVTPPRSMGAFVFDVRILGASMAEIQRAKKDLEAFLQEPEDNANPLYFEWRADNNVSAEPVWGQFGANKRAEVLDGYVDWWDNYDATQYSKRGGKLVVTLTLGAIEGKRQLLAQAKGGICEDWIGATDGKSRGVMIPEADATNGNKITNPVYGHATWNTGWTAGAGITAAKNTDPAFVLFGLNSAKLTCNSATVADNEYTQSINVVNATAHVLSCYAKLPDSGAISTSQCSLTYNGSTITTTFTSVGNGWYRLTGSLTGANAARTYGIRVVNKYTVYVDAWQLEERVYATSFFYGDMLGCHWAGTAHESASHRDIPTVSIPTAGLYSPGGGTIRLVWRADKASSAYTAPGYFFWGDGAGSNLYLFYNAPGQDEFNFGGVSISPVSFSAGDRIIFHASWIMDGTTYLFRNGTQLVTAGTWTPVLTDTNLYIGNNNSTSVLGGTFEDFTIFNHAMTTAEITADYNNILQITTDGQGLGGIPYIWSASADGVVQNADDGTNQNWAVIGGIPGDLAALVEARMVTSTNEDDVYIGNLDVPYQKFIDPEFLFLAGAPDAVSINTTDVAMATVDMDNDEFEMIKGKHISVMVRTDEDAGGNNLLWRTGVNPGGGYYYTPYEASNWIASASNDYSIDLSPQIAIPNDEGQFRIQAVNRVVKVCVTGYRSAAGALTINVVSAQIVPYPMIRFTCLATAGTASGILYVDNRAYMLDGSLNLYYKYQTSGDKLQFVPGRYNVLISYVGKEATASVATATLTYSSIYVTPRWSTM